MHIKFKFYIIVLVFPVFFLLSCEKENTDTKPVSSVYFEIDLRISPYSKLIGLGTFLTCPNEYSKGVWGPAGIIIVHTPEDTYMVIDRCCRNAGCETKNNPVYMEESTIGYASCKACGSRYFMLMGYGTVENGPATKPLRAYPTPAYVTNSNILRYNYTATY